MKKIAIYTRVSTNDQTTENQRLDLLKYSKLRAYEIVEIYEDKGVSGSKSSRPALDQMMIDASNGRFEIVLVWKLDRLGRSLANLISLLNALNQSNVSFISMQENIDLTNPAGVLFFQLLASFGEFELSMIKSRVNAGLRRARAENIKLGRPKKTFDFKKALDLHSQGLGLRKIAKILDVSTTTVHKYLSNCS